MNERWSLADIRAIYVKPFHDLIFNAHTIHRENHNAQQIQLAKLLSIKTGACPENCGYCSQSGHYQTHAENKKLLPVEQALMKAHEAKAQGATRFCMGAAWRSPPDKAMPQLIELIKEVKAMGLETCMTLGMLNEDQAKTLKTAGLDYYNHNIDTSPSYYQNVATTRTFDDRLKTLENLRKAQIKMCCGGILGLGESREDRIEFLYTLANMETPPESLPINRLIPVAGTPLANAPQVEGLELVRTIATARIIMPKSTIRLTAGRAQMSDELQALCFFSGANSVFIGDKLLTEDNPGLSNDRQLFSKLGLKSFEQV